MRKPSSGSGRHPGHAVGTSKGSAKQDTEFRLFSSFSRLNPSSLSGCWSPPHSECLFCPSSAGAGLVTQKSFSTSRFSLVFVLSLVVLIAFPPFNSLQEAETLWQVLTGKLEFGPCRFQQKPPSLTSVLSHPFLQILARSKTIPTRQMFPLNLGMSTKPLKQSPQMESKLSCLLPFTNRKKTPTK